MPGNAFTQSQLLYCDVTAQLVLAASSSRAGASGKKQAIALQIHSQQRLDIPAYVAKCRFRQTAPWDGVLENKWVHTVAPT